MLYFYSARNEAMSIITLISDMGGHDYYVGALKGALLSALPTATVVDVTHDVEKNGGVVMGGFILRNSYRLFPPGTVHIVAVDTNIGLESRHVVFEHEGHYFVGTDNGIFSLAFDSTPQRIFDISHLAKDSLTFPAIAAFVPVAAALVGGRRPEELGKAAIGLVEKKMFRATVEPAAIVGTVIYVDSYGNAITNVDRRLFEEVRKDRSYTIYVRSMGYAIRKISQQYTEAAEGELVAVFNHAGNLELAIHNGSIAMLLGLTIGSSIRIEFR